LLVGTISSQSFASDGHWQILEWGSFGIINPGEFNLPQQIAVDDERNIYVADTGNSKIQKFTSNGKFLSSWEAVQSPVGIAVYENYVYVVDDVLYCSKI